MREAEIGGIFDIDEQRDCLRVSGTNGDPEFASGDATLTLSGRTALDLILSEVHNEAAPALSDRPLRAYLPTYCCQSMIDPFARQGFCFDFYTVFLDDTGKLAYEIDIEHECDVFVATSYFGFSETDMDGWISTFRQRGVTVVEDATHRLFNVPSAASCADFTFGSIRKWLGTPAGGFARRRDGRVRVPQRGAGRVAEVGKQAMNLKSRYLAGDASLDVRTSILSLQAEQSALLSEDFHDRDIDQLSAEIVRRANVQDIRARRLANSRTLILGVADLPGVELPVKLNPDVDCPLFVPIIVPSVRRSRIIAAMREQGLYMPVHWPRPTSVPTGSSTDRLYEGEISLVCDQRYTCDDMTTIVNFLQEIAC